MSILNAQSAASAMFGGNYLEAADALKKALEANAGGTDFSQFSGGAALGMESLDGIMKATLQDNQHFVAFNKLRSSNATNIIDQYVTQTAVGGFPGGSSISQLATVRNATGEYKREVGQVKLMAQLRQVGHVLEAVGNIVDPIAAEERNGALGILTDTEYQILHGNADACPVHFDGIMALIDKQIAAGKMSEEHVIDLQGKALDSVDSFAKLQATIKRYGSWGSLTDALVSVGVQADLNMGLDPAFRWLPDGNNMPMLGGHVDAIRLSGGRLAVTEDTFLIDNEFPMGIPFEVNYPTIAAANAGLNPASLSVSASASSADSQFDAARAGNYYYAVAAIDGEGKGYSQVVKSAQVAVAAGKKVVLTISESAVAGAETGYALYRSRLGGTNNTDDLRLMAVIAKMGATTVYTDLNRDIPGTVTVPCLNMNPGADAIGWRQFYPMSKIPLPFGMGGAMVHSWFQFMYGYLRMTKPKHHGYIKNIVPSNAKWKPFG